MNFEKAEKKPVDIEFSSEDGRVTWREIYEGNSVGELNASEIQTDDTKGFLELKKKLFRERGLGEKQEEL